jgi:uncharacterized cupredoxin-like copper-binding protein
MRRACVVVLVASAALATGVSLSVAASSQSTLKYTLKEMSVAGKTSATSGRITFVATNSGTVAHELVIMRSAAPLTVKRYKAVEAGRWLGEVEEIEPGKIGKVTLDLAPGKYLLLCNIVGHYQLGMKTVLQVK